MGALWYFNYIGCKENLTSVALSLLFWHCLLVINGIVLILRFLLGGRFRSGEIRPGRPVHELRRHEVPHQVGAARGAKLHALLIQVRCMGIWWVSKFTINYSQVIDIIAWLPLKKNLKISIYRILILLLSYSSLRKYLQFHKNIFRVDYAWGLAIVII